MAVSISQSIARCCPCPSFENEIAAGTIHSPVRWPAQISPHRLIL